MFSFLQLLDFMNFSANKFQEVHTIYYLANLFSKLFF